MSDRRAFWRASPSLTVSYEPLENYRNALPIRHFRQVEVINVGGGGMLMETDEFVVPETLIMLEINLPCHHQPVIALGQTVRSEQIDGASENRWRVAFQFVLVNEKEQDKLVEHVLGCTKTECRRQRGEAGSSFTHEHRP